MKRHAAVIGHPIAHSRSPELFARFAASAGIALTYRAVDIPPEALATTLDSWRNDAAFVGCNVTIPHKERALALADEADEVARGSGAANVLTHDGRSLVASNTDVEAIESALRESGFDLHGARVAILGSGGAARAVAYAARRSGAKSIAIAARNVERARALAAAFDAHACALDAIPAADLYVNATPVGMTGREQGSLLPSNAAAGAFAFDLVYTPIDTPFLHDARARGLHAMDGWRMFVAQAAATFRRWFGVVPEVVEA
ncbi:MAG: shikimate dehydrogenase [Candidatus Eremiobacteraeota bacterium]|nr:shikimate dehydrogenase [Candidatus Eremiobacteraeota bacterium]